MLTSTIYINLSYIRKLDFYYKASVKSATYLVLVGKNLERSRDLTAPETGGIRIFSLRWLLEERQNVFLIC